MKQVVMLQLVAMLVTIAQIPMEIGLGTNKPIQITLLLPKVENIELLLVMKVDVLVGSISIRTKTH